eukprot:1594616-Pleurochrysis_carterae.AAC.3
MPEVYRKALKDSRLLWSRVTRLGAKMSVSGGRSCRAWPHSVRTHLPALIGGFAHADASCCSCSENYTPMPCSATWPTLDHSSPIESELCHCRCHQSAALHPVLMLARALLAAVAAAAEVVREAVAASDGLHSCWIVIQGAEAPGSSWIRSWSQRALLCSRRRQNSHSGNPSGPRS